MSNILTIFDLAGDAGANQFIGGVIAI